MTDSPKRRTPPHVCGSPMLNKNKRGSYSDIDIARDQNDNHNRPINTGYTYQHARYIRSQTSQT
ncbi:hypothetical protein PAXINDRAFT_169403 [Paxillus involutus ATCC 200175]|uniref:Uncharacterized protein n=1 Tax=Paxillus involutus ATCC 200175 TaxID=664439 RepID=A0A0C9SYG4_PAXIN|nr:hypothetical protein PAXINDRAFT_169403 [Paxillus involutus ATCC 200175]